MENLKKDTIISNNKNRIAKNTVFLYVRMLLVMCVSLYTVRVILSVLGSVDYGIYNVIGGLVVMFSFLSSTLASASQRYFAFELGKGDKKSLNNVFCINLQLYAMLSLLIFIISETIGIWYLNTYMSLPEDRVSAANWIFQFSIMSYLLKMLATPYQAVIIAHEKMSVYAYVGIIEVLLGLIIAFLVDYIDYDKLIIYGLFILVSNFIVASLYIFYSRINFEEVKYHLTKDKSKTKEILSYSGWTLFSGIANMARSEGVNLLLNSFFNPVVNAARGIAYQINHAITMFASNFYTAVRPQMTKYYAQDKRTEWLSLSYTSSKYCGYLVLMFSIPLMVYADVLLRWWLVEVPEYTIIFTRLVILTAFIDSMANPLATIVQATGKVKYYHIITGGLLLLNLPLAWGFLILGFEPQVTMIISIIVSVIALFARLCILKSLVNYPLRRYTTNVLVSTTIVLVLSLAAVYSTRCFFSSPSGLLGCIETFGISVIIFFCIVLSMGITSKERRVLFNFIKSRINKRKEA